MKMPVTYAGVTLRLTPQHDLKAYKAKYFHENLTFTVKTIPFVQPQNKQKNIQLNFSKQEEFTPQNKYEFKA